MNWRLMDSFWNLADDAVTGLGNPLVVTSALVFPAFHRTTQRSQDRESLDLRIS